MQIRKTLLNSPDVGEFKSSASSNVWAQVVNVIQVQDEDCRGNVGRTGAGVIQAPDANQYAAAADCCELTLISR